MWLQNGYSYQMSLDSEKAPCYNGGTVKERRAPAESGAQTHTNNQSINQSINEKEKKDHERKHN